LAHAKFDLRGIQRLDRAVNSERPGMKVKALGLDLSVQHQAALAGVDAEPSARGVGAAVFDAERGFGGEARAVAELKIGAGRGSERDERRREKEAFNAE